MKREGERMSEGTVEHFKRTTLGLQNDHDGEPKGNRGSVVFTFTRGKLEVAASLVVEEKDACGACGDGPLKSPSPTSFGHRRHIRSITGVG